MPGTEPPPEPKIRDLFQQRIFETDAVHLPFHTLPVVEDVNEGYRCVSRVFYGSEDHWRVVRKRLAKRLRDGHQDGLSFADDFDVDYADLIESTHRMGDEEFGLLAHEYQCNAILIEVKKLPAGGYYVSRVTKYAGSSEGFSVGFINYEFPSIVCVKRDDRIEIVRELCAETGEIYNTEKRRRELMRLKEQVSGRKIPGLFIEGMNVRGLTGGNIKNAWAVLKTEPEKDHFIGRMLPSAESRKRLLDHCAQEVRRKDKERK